jgi:uncharacterized surface protein with fasciclin (FAS1) repeats
MRMTLKQVAAIAGASMFALAAPASAQEQPGGTISPPGEPRPEAPPETPAPREPAVPTPPAETPAPSTPSEVPGPAPSQAEQPPVTTNTAQTVAANVVAAERLSTLESAVVAAGLAEALGGEGPFTVFAPDNLAFTLVRPDALQALMQPANREQLSNVLQAHVVAGRVTAADLMQQIRLGGGRATLQTIGGDQLTATAEGDSVVLTGANNSRAFVTQADANASNGVIHIVNGVLLPAD